MRKFNIVITVDEEALKQARHEAVDAELPRDEYEINEAINTEMGWVEYSGIFVESISEIT